MADDSSQEAGCLRLIEALAHGDPVPDTSAICHERNEVVALLAEISKGERSEFLPQIAQVAERRGISPQEIASRAGFLLACLDMPGDDDPYSILGVPLTAPPQEIRNAWVARLSLYHPDRHPSNGDWFTRQAARLNEAYHILKDPARRQAYDERRRREGLRRPRHGPNALRPGARLPRIPVIFDARMRRRLPTLLTGGAIVAAGLILLLLFLARPALRPEATPLSAAKTPGSVDERSSVLGPTVDDQRSPGPSQAEPEKERVRQLHSRVMPARRMQRDVQKVSDVSGERATLAQALPPLLPEPKGLDRQEIDALLDEYVDAYEKGDVERVMATFSPKVREKGTLDYQAIRTLYAKGFTGREQIIYRLKNVDVQIKGDLATVTAQYLISARNANQSQKNVTVSGRIEWKVQREGEKPKFIAINY
jgi:ketosteroid isomerase-like protein